MLHFYESCSLLTVVLICQLLHPLLSQTPIEDTIVKEQEKMELPSVDISHFADNTYVKVTFNVTNDVRTSAFLVATTNETIKNKQLKLEDFHDKLPRITDAYDLDAMWDFRNQEIHVKKQGNILYLIVYNFDPKQVKQNVEFKITINQDQTNTTLPDCAPCRNSQPQNSSTCQCECEQDVSGLQCSRTVSNIPQSTQQPIKVPAYQQKFLKAEGQKTYFILGLVSGQAFFYLKTGNPEKEVASFFNVINKYKYYFQGQKTETKIFDRTTETLLITVNNYSDRQIKVYIEVGASNQTNNLTIIIVMSVLASILAIILFVAAIFIIRRHRQNSSIRSELNLPSDKTKLSAQQVDRFFPPCKMMTLSENNEQNSSDKMNITSTDPLIKPESDCVICLEALHPTEQIRIGYCRHIFHSNCLVGWFSKHQNCPYCRKQYSRQDTINEYNKLCELANQPVLFREDLAKEILKTKPASNLLDEKDIA